MIRSLPYKWYKYKIYKKTGVKELRGANFLLRLLRKVAFLGLEKVDEGQTKGIFDLGEWDNLVILDACRYDFYKEQVEEEEIKSRYTLGSNSGDFVKKNFRNTPPYDIIAITANPHYSNPIFKNLAGRNVDDVFYTVFNTYETDWDEKLGVVPPSSVKERALTAEKLFSDKKKIIHFMQPHAPYLTSNMEQAPNKLDVEGISHEANSDAEECEIWRAEKGKVSREVLIKHYKENLDLVMSAVRELAKELDGKTVVTADHGELLGENGTYGHPAGRKEKFLRKVPWHRLNTNQ